MIKALFVFGTRPEAIKMVPLILRMKEEDGFEPVICLTGQHRSMIDGVMDFFNLSPDYDFDLMDKFSTMGEMVAEVIRQVSVVIGDISPDIIIVQGDTNSAFAGGVAAFYAGKRVAHIEAGLRSYNRFAPYPEEVNRKMLSALCDLHFAPTPESVRNLENELITDNIYMVGNTVIDSLFLARDLAEKSDIDFVKKYPYIKDGKKVVLFTAHRRESLGEKYRGILEAAKKICNGNTGIEMIFPMHLNPVVRSTINSVFKKVPDNLHLVEPLDYAEMVYLMARCYLMISDSGGIQEEAAALGVPVLILRDVTERTEVVDLGVASLVGTRTEDIVQHAERLLNNREEYLLMARPVFPYGNGDSSIRILKILKQYFNDRK